MVSVQAGCEEEIEVKDQRFIPKRFRGLYQKAINGSRKAAIRFGCLECMGFVSGEVKRCSRPECGFYHYREKG